MWGTEVAPARTLDWAWARTRLERAECYWLVSSASTESVPAPRPVWGVWVDDRLLLSVGSPSHWHNMARNPAVAVHLGDPVEVVIVEGRARKGTGTTLLARFVDMYNDKYDWDFEPTMPIVVDGVIEVVASTVIAWVAADAAHSSSDMDVPLAAGKWLL